MADDIEIDDSEFQKKMDDFVSKKFPDQVQQANHDVATEVLRLSALEVPHDVGTLQNSGNIVDEEDQSVVGYNTVYAAHLHEHPEFNFGKGRKGKYLEDPIKNNTAVFIRFFRKTLGEIFK